MILVYTTALFAGITATKAPILPASSAPVKEIRLPDNIFNFVHAHRQGKDGTVSWSSSATPATVVHFEVMRTYEDPYDPYSEWACINTYNCSSGKNYKCTDQNLSPGFVNYKVVATLTNGSTVESDVETLHIVQH